MSVIIITLIRDIYHNSFRIYLDSANNRKCPLPGVACDAAERTTKFIRRRTNLGALLEKQRALKLEPTNAAVRTDMATAYWYTGNADAGIAEFQKSLSYEPNQANTFFNLGIVEWQGKMDIDKAVATWQKLLDTNPNYEGKDKVLELMAQRRRTRELNRGRRQRRQRRCSNGGNHERSKTG